MIRIRGAEIDIWKWTLTSELSLQAPYLGVAKTSQMRNLLSHPAMNDEVGAEPPSLLTLSST